MDKGIHIGGWGQIQGEYIRNQLPLSQSIANLLHLSGISNYYQNGKSVGINRLMSIDISPCWPVGIQDIASARMAGTKRSQMLSTPVLRLEVMEQQIQTPGGRKSGVLLAGLSSITPISRKFFLS